MPSLESTMNEEPFPVDHGASSEADSMDAAAADLGADIPRAEAVVVACRFRPEDHNERKKGGKSAKMFNITVDEASDMIVLEENAFDKSKDTWGTSGVTGRNPQRIFHLDKVFDSDATQSRVFNEAARNPVLWVSRGYNASIFAYGQTGTGKTHTMFGPDKKGADRGIIPRAVELLFYELNKMEEIDELSVSCSFLEIYREHILDLFAAAEKGPALNSTANLEAYLSGSMFVGGGQESQENLALAASSLRLRENTVRGVFAEGLIERELDNPDMVVPLIRSAEQYRKTACTAMNQRSSRSHTVFTITVLQRLKDRNVRISKLNLIDLAGSENLSKSQAQGKAMKETGNINKSLSALGNVIYALTDRRRTHVPYRDSTLTFLLRDSLGGNTKTVLLVTASPHAFNYQETLSTLKFAQRAKKVKNKPIVNEVESVEQLKAIILELRARLVSRDARIKELEGVLNSIKQGASVEDVAGQLERAAEKERRINQRETLLMEHIRRLEAMSPDETDGDVHEEFVQNTVALNVLQEGAVFTKFKYRAFFLSKPTRKRLIYDQYRETLYYHDAKKKPGFKGKAIPLKRITGVSAGKSSKTFESGEAAKADERRSFSVILTDRTLDFQADDEETRDLWVAAFVHLTSREEKKVARINKQIRGRVLSQSGRVDLPPIPKVKDIQPLGSTLSHDMHDSKSFTEDEEWGNLTAPIPISNLNHTSAFQFNNEDDDDDDEDLDNRSVATLNDGDLPSHRKPSSRRGSQASLRGENESTASSKHRSARHRKSKSMSNTGTWSSSLRSPSSVSSKRSRSAHGSKRKSSRKSATLRSKSNPRGGRKSRSCGRNGKAQKDRSTPKQRIRKKKRDAVAGPVEVESPPPQSHRNIHRGDSTAEPSETVARKAFVSDSPPPSAPIGIFDGDDDEEYFDQEIADVPSTYQRDDPSVRSITDERSYRSGFSDSDEEEDVPLPPSSTPSDDDEVDFEEERSPSLVGASSVRSHSSGGRGALDGIDGPKVVPTTAGVFVGRRVVKTEPKMLSSSDFSGEGSLNDNQVGEPDENDYQQTMAAFFN